MPALIEVRISGTDEILLKMEQVPQRIRNALKVKLNQEVEILRQKFAESLPGKYVDPERVISGVDEVTPSLIAGYIEVGEKGGKYTILPTKANLLRFLGKDGSLVFTKMVLHPYISAGVVAPHLESLISRELPEIESNLEDVVIEEL